MGFVSASCRERSSQTTVPKLQAAVLQAAVTAPEHQLCGSSAGCANWRIRFRARPVAVALLARRAEGQASGGRAQHPMIHIPDELDLQGTAPEGKLARREAELP